MQNLRLSEDDILVPSMTGLSLTLMTLRALWIKEQIRAGSLPLRDDQLWRETEVNIQVTRFGGTGRGEGGSIPSGALVIRIVLVRKMRVEQAQVFPPSSHWDAAPDILVAS